MADVACFGIRGVQQIRRSRSASRIVGKAQRKACGSKACSVKHETESQKLLKSLLDFGIQLSSTKLAKTTNGVHVVNHEKVEAKEVKQQWNLSPSVGTWLARLPKVFDQPKEEPTTGEPQEVTTICTAAASLSLSRYYYGKEMQFYEEFYIAAGADEYFDDQYKKVALLQLPPQEPRYFFGKEIFSYEDFFLHAGADEQFDDEYIQQDTSRNLREPRYYFGREIHCYEELYNLVGDSTGTFDDEQPEAEKMSDDICRHFYCREVESYEDFYIIAGASGQFDDECI